MAAEQLILIPPTLELANEFLAMNKEYRQVSDERFKAIADLYRTDLDHSNLALYLQQLLENAQGRNLKPGYVPASTFWLVRNDTNIVGVSHLRHWLTPALEREGGHIGYNVRPSERRKGYGTRLLALTLEQARKLGMSSVLITCDGDNAASARVITNNGGQLIDHATPHPGGRTILRYRIQL